MKIIKPLRLGVMSRPFSDLELKPCLSVSILAMTNMRGQPILSPEPELWKLVKNELSFNGEGVDLSYPKYYAEYLVSGHAYPHSYVSVNVCHVNIKLGEKQKRLIITGDREWQGEIPSSPSPFDSIPVDWSRAYGGSQIPDNPFGIGATVSKAVPQRLPNIELPDDRAMSPVQQVAPAGFAAIDITRPARQKLIGKRYNEKWLRNGATGFAEDADPRLFNIAPRDQQWQDLAELPCGMSFQIENMHPYHSMLEGQLPPWKARCFAHHTENEEEVFSEIEMRHTTVWFLPHLEKMIFVYHGELTIGEDDANNVHMLMPAIEHESQPRSLRHYQNVWIKRSDRDKGSSFAFQEGDLLPIDAVGPWIDNSKEPVDANPLQQNLNVRKAAIYQDTEHRLHAVDSKLPEGTKESSDIEQPTLSQLPEFMRQMEEKARSAKEDAVRLLEQRLPDVDVEGSWRPTGPEALNKMREALLQQQEGILLPGQEEGLHQIYRLGVQSQIAAPQLRGERAVQLREWVIAKMKQDKDFSGCDLTGADLSHLDLSFANFTRTMMESTNLSHSILNNAILTQAILARSLLNNTSLKSTLLNEVTLALANCNDSDFTRAEMSNAVTDGGQFERCNFGQAKITQQMFTNTSLTDCDFTAASLENVIFEGVALGGPVFSSALLHKCTFIDCHLQKAIFKNSQLVRCSIMGSRGDGVDFTHAQLENCAFVGASSLENSCFSHAILVQCNLRQMPMNGADLSFSIFDGGDLSEASLKKATLYRTQANGVLFIRTNLEGADLRQVSLIGSRLQKSRLIGCDLSEANLFRADISQAEIDETTLMQDAWVKQMKIYPLHDKETE